MFGEDSVYLPQTPSTTNWMGRETKKRYKKSCFDFQPNFGEQQTHFLLKDEYNLKIDGIEVYTFKTSSFNVLFHMLRAIVINDQSLENFLVQSLEECKIDNDSDDSEDELQKDELVNLTFLTNALTARKVDVDSIYKFRTGFYLEMLKSSEGINNLNCAKPVEKIYKDLFKNMALFQRMVFCGKCHSKIIARNLVKIEAIDFSDFESKAKDLMLECSKCQSQLSNHVDCLLSFVINSDAGSQQNFTVSLAKIGREITVNGSSYMICGIVILETGKDDSSHYVALVRDPLRLASWVIYDGNNKSTKEISNISRKKFNVKMIFAKKL